MIEPQVVVTVNDEMRDLEERYDKLLARVSKLEQAQRGASLLDDPERLMNYGLMAYLILMIAPEVARALERLWKD